MMSRRLLLAGIVLALVVAPRSITAQGRAGGVELGFDAGVEFSNVEDIDIDDGPAIESGDELRFGVPIQRFRVGYHASDLISIEPSVGLDYFRVEDPTDDTDDADASATDLEIGLALLIHFRSDPDNPVAYAIARGTYNMLDINEPGGDEDDDSLTQVGAGVGVGVKLPVADRLDVRLEGMFERRFENEDDVIPNSNNYQLNVGFSWYTGTR
jgi:opacity protein-like surface antigen